MKTTKQPKASARLATPKAIHADNCPCDACAGDRAKNRPACVVGYARVSTDKQETRSQVDALKAAGCDPIFEETNESGSKISRPELDKCLAFLKPGDTLIVWKLDRFGRKAGWVSTTIDDFVARGIKFRSLTEGIDPTTTTGKAFFTILAAFAQMEREVTIERINATLGAKKRRGEKVGGRYFQLSRAQVDDALSLCAGGRSLLDVAKTLGVSRTTLYRALQRREQETINPELAAIYATSQPERRPKSA